MLLYGRCCKSDRSSGPGNSAFSVETCPRGFHESGAYCHHDDEELFWGNSTAQQDLQKTLNEGVC